MEADVEDTACHRRFQLRRTGVALKRVLIENVEENQRLGLVVGCGPTGCITWPLATIADLYTDQHSIILTILRRIR